MLAGIIFPGEATFAYVEQARSNPTNPRVYLLKLAGSNEKMFFWMQEPDASKDEDICKKVNARLNGEEAPGEGGGGDAAGLSGMDQRQLLAMLTGQVRMMVVMVMVMVMAMMMVMRSSLDADMMPRP